MADLEAPTTNGESSKVLENDDNSQEHVEPAKKRRKCTDVTSENLERRLGTILCCTVCWDLPKGAVYQCANGHLMCVGCFTHLLADARLRDDVSTCPNCRVEISKTSVLRNLAVEKAANELPSPCKYCDRNFPRNALDRHEQLVCEERIVHCKYNRIGCPWRGPFHEQSRHEEVCVHSRRTGAEIMIALQVIDLNREKELKLFASIVDLLSYENITLSDLQFKPYRTDEYTHKLYYETKRFSAFNKQWVVKAGINSSHADPAQSYDREMSYQLSLKSKTTTPLNVNYFIVHGPFGDMRVSAEICHFDFTDQDSESSYSKLPLTDSDECDRLLAEKYINFRLIMFLTSN